MVGVGWVSRNKLNYGDKFLVPFFLHLGPLFGIHICSVVNSTVGGGIVDNFIRGIVEVLCKCNNSWRYVNLNETFHNGM